MFLKSASNGSDKNVTFFPYFQIISPLDFAQRNNGLYQAIFGPAQKKPGQAESHLDYSGVRFYFPRLFGTNFPEFHI
jgi:hypothetical protein